MRRFGGRQANLELARAGRTVRSAGRETRPPRPHAPSDAEAAAHANFVAGIKDPIWKV